MKNALIAITLVLGGWTFSHCHALTPAPRLLGDRVVSERMKNNCRLAERRCSLCHTLGRIEAAQITKSTHWRSYVNRMRLMPGSGIRSSDVEPIVECLTTVKGGVQ